MTTDQESPQPEAYAFRLFAPSKPTVTSPSTSPPKHNAAPSASDPASGAAKHPKDEQILPTIRLDPNPAPAALLSPDGVQVLGKRKRPDSYYFAAPPDEEAKSRFRLAAVEGTEVLKQAGWEWFGWRMPWRVVPAEERAKETQGVLSGAGAGERIRLDNDLEQGSGGDAAAAAGNETGGQGESKKRKCRKSKATRIKIRIRLRAVEEEMQRKKVALNMRKQEEKQKDVEKEVHLREKKAKMNRKKQIKKRERRRAEKGVVEGEVRE